MHPRSERESQELQSPCQCPCGRAFTPTILPEPRGHFNGVRALGLPGGQRMPGDFRRLDCPIRTPAINILTRFRDGEPLSPDTMFRAKSRHESFASIHKCNNDKLMTQ